MVNICLQQHHEVWNTVPVRLMRVEGEGEVFSDFIEVLPGYVTIHVQVVIPHDGLQGTTGSFGLSVCLWCRK